MGRIKTLMVKKTARNLANEEGFSEDFEENKKKLKDTMPSKSIRNKIAGYISRIIKYKKAE